MRYFYLLTLFIITVSCQDLVHERGNGNIVTDEREVEEFDGLNLRGSYQVFLNQGSRTRLVIETDENLLEYIETEVRGGILYIDNLEKISSKEGTKIYLTFEQLDWLSSAGASTIKTESLLTTESLEVSMPGAGILDLQLEVQDLKIDLAGAGLVKLEGWAQNQEIKMSGIGNLEGYELRSRTCKVTVSGLGNAQVNVSENLTARINGMGGIKYKGSPVSIDEKVSGLGKITNVTEKEAI